MLVIVQVLKDKIGIKNGGREDIHKEIKNSFSH